MTDKIDLTSIKKGLKQEVLLIHKNRDAGVGTDEEIEIKKLSRIDYATVKSYKEDEDITLQIVTVADIYDKLLEMEEE